MGLENIHALYVFVDIFSKSVSRNGSTVCISLNFNDTHAAIQSGNDELYRAELNCITWVLAGPSSRNEAYIREIIIISAILKSESGKSR